MQHPQLLVEQSLLLLRPRIPPLLEKPELNLERLSQVKFEADE
jgi:hypothetical protein